MRNGNRRPIERRLEKIDVKTVLGTRVRQRWIAQGLLKKTYKCSCNSNPGNSEREGPAASLDKCVDERMRMDVHADNRDALKRDSIGFGDYFVYGNLWEGQILADLTRLE
jgi:hypothetical protein